jgi:hypothetical protein
MIARLGSDQAIAGEQWVVAWSSVAFGVEWWER